MEYINSLSQMEKMQEVCTSVGNILVLLSAKKSTTQGIRLK